MGKRYVLGPNAAREVSKLIRGTGEVSRRCAFPPSVAFDSEFACPFHVQWSATAANCAGAWIIWLPGEELVNVDGTALDPSEDLTAVGGDYPTGWFILDDSVLDSTDGGTLYLHITRGDTPACEFAASNVVADDDTIAVAICEATFDADTGARSVMQFVTASIVIAGGDGDATHYGCDEKSISLVASQDATDPTQTTKSNMFHLVGFGKFSATGHAAAIGTYTAPSTAELELDGAETDFACIVRTGNTTAADGNAIGYRKLKLVGSAGSSPFQYVKTATGSATSHTLVNCSFYWNGELKSLADFDASSVVSGGSVYLRGTQAAPTAATPEPTWQWTLGTSVAAAPEGGKVLNYKLYDFANNAVSVDYRTTFLSLEDHTAKAKVEVKKPNGAASVVLDAAGTDPSVVVSDGNGKSITLDTADLDANEGVAVRELTIDGDETPVAKVLATDDFEIAQKSIVAGDHIEVTENEDGDEVTVGLSASGTHSGSLEVVVDVDYDSSSHSLRKKCATLTFEDGLLTAISVDADYTAYTTAVEET